MIFEQLEKEHFVGFGQTTAKTNIQGNVFEKVFKPLLFLTHFTDLHFRSSMIANNAKLKAREGVPFVNLAPKKHDCC